MTLQSLKDECLSCRKCPVGGQMIDGHVSNVFSNMNLKARIMVVGQNPGRDEVQQGEPFVGTSGKVFNEIAKEEIGLDRSDFYISNTIRCYTPSNRKPTITEIENCSGFLQREIDIVKPKVVIALGSVAFEFLTGMHGIMKHIGEVAFSIRYKVPVIAVLHPSPYNTNNPENRKKFIDGMRKVKEYLDSNG